ncbi:TonB-dependent receptor [Tolypothrix campylonemoides VB511288]|nr:TonB-dependent receptor [Tolypothrix campylonemoides VB511288]
MRRTGLAVGVRCALTGAALAMGIATAHARQAPSGAADASAAELDRVVVTGEIVYRDRADATPPTLSYDLEYFQRFEPLTVGDMLKRVPSVAFVSDVLEYDGARLRGLDPGYTQVLVNGKKVPGGENDRAFFVDRIPAELVERIEIVRSPSANRSGDAVAGALNIVLRDAYEFDGGYLRAGALRFDDGETKGTFGAVAGGEFAGGRLLGGINTQGRYNPKKKHSDRFEEPGGDFVDREDQDDVRDGTDTSANLSFVRDLGPGRLSLSGVHVRTDREEREHSEEYNVPAGTSRDNLLSVNDQLQEIDQRNTSLGAGYTWDGFGGTTGIDLGFAQFEEARVDTEEEFGFDDEDTPPSFDGLEGARTLTDIDDREAGAKIAHVRDFGGAKLEFGVDAQRKQRDTILRVSEVEVEAEDEDEGDPLPPYADFERSDSRIEERRLDPYVMLSGDAGAVRWEAGLRYETTDVDVELDGGTAGDTDFALLLPSVHLRWDFDATNRIRASVGRTVRRPNFDFLLPQALEGEYGDNDFIGDPTLEPETAWGLDVGYERRLGRRGVVGVNVFYRKVRDLIELVNTGDPSEAALEDYEEEVEEFLDENPGADETTPGFPEFDPDSFVYTAGNVGDGAVYGVEFDLSTPLSALGLEHTGVFFNAAWLDSEVDDALGERRFNNQARYVFNVGFIQDLPSLDAAFGVTYREQGEAESRVLAEEVRTEYDGDLEAFVEKRFGTSWAVRLTASNLLDARKDEVFDKFDTLADQIDRDYDEYELESEKAGPVYQLVVRYAF